MPQQLAERRCFTSSISMYGPAPSGNISSATKLPFIAKLLRKKYYKFFVYINIIERKPEVQDGVTVIGGTGWRCCNFGMDRTGLSVMIVIKQKNLLLIITALYLIGHNSLTLLCTYKFINLNSNFSFYKAINYIDRNVSGAKQLNIFDGRSLDVFTSCQE